MSKELIPVAKFGAPHGLKGFIRVIPFIDPAELLLSFNSFVVEDDNESWDIVIETIKPHKKNNFLLKIDELDNISDVEHLTHKRLFVKRSDMPQLPKGSFYIGDLVGCKVFDILDTYHGEIEDVLQYSANDIYVISFNNKSYMLPAVKECIIEVNIDDEKVIVNLPDGIMEI